MWSCVLLLLFFNACTFNADETVASTESSNVICPDGRLECAGHSTCCALAGGYYGCCPFPNATCCADKLHCCPPGTTCDLERGQCRKSTNNNEIQLNIWEDLTHASLVRKAIISNATLQRSNPLNDNQMCPGGSKTCPDSYTCCALPDEGYGCCPIRNAVCCSDRIHCCPPDSECTGGGCKKKSLANTSNNVRCDDGWSQCPDGTTCCLTLSGGYGCCPLKEAICCDDKQHCCPSGYKCLSTGYCTKVAKPYDLLFLRAFAKTKVLAKKIA